MSYRARTYFNLGMTACASICIGGLAGFIRMQGWL